MLKLEQEPFLKLYIEPKRNRKRKDKNKMLN